MSRPRSETRNRILSAAMQLLEENRGQGVRMSDIAKAAAVSRQAVYLHFKSRTELMVATVQYVDEVKSIAERRRIWDEAASGVQMLDAYIEFWGNYSPEIYGVAKILLMAVETDEAARAAWDDRMRDLRSGCRMTMEALVRDQMLSAGWTLEEATDLLWSLLSVRHWEQLTMQCGWSNDAYIRHMQLLAKRAFCG